MPNPNPARSIISFRHSAKQYVDAQLNVMEKYGSSPTLSFAEYDGLVTEVAEIGKRLWLSTGGRIETK